MAQELLWKTVIRAGRVIVSKIHQGSVVALCVVLTLTLTAPAGAQFDSGSDGSDGAFLPTQPTTIIDLSQAVTAPWDTPSPQPGMGVYDPDLWVVVFKFTTITIPSGVTVSFTNHPSGAPVVWLATGNVTIQGKVNLDGQPHSGQNIAGYTIPGPGGFAGGLHAASGLGPGGGNPSGGGNFAYGNPNILPLIGGSGGGGRVSSPLSGGAGGGAILIASSATISFLAGGEISARGGAGTTPSCPSTNSAGGGSGGAVRLVANSILGPASLLVSGGVGGSPACPTAGGTGRIRIEAYDLSEYTGTSGSMSGPGPIFPPSNAPRIRATAVNGAPVPADPASGPWTTELVLTGQLLTIDIEANNIPPGTSVAVQIRPKQGSTITVTSSPLAGSLSFSTAQALVLLPDSAGNVPFEIQLKADW